MSGPKINVYSLTPAQRAAIQEQLRRRREQIEKERIERERERERKRQEKIRIDAKKVELETLKRTTDSLINELSGYSDLASQATGIVDASAFTDMIQSAQQSVEILNMQIRQGISSTDLVIVEEIASKVADGLASTRERIKDIENESVQIGGSLQDKLTEVVESLFSQPIDTSRKKAESEVQERINASQAVLLGFLESDYLPITLKTTIREALERLEKMPSSAASSYIEIEIQPIIKRCQEHVKKWKKYGEEYKALMIQYESLIALNHRESFIQTVPFDENAVVHLRKLIAIEEQIALDAAEREYISDTLTDVMQEMGYTILGKREVKKRNGRHLSKRVFHYGEGTAIDITYADDGQITMELGALDKSDRLPSETETVHLLSEMEAFCEDFAAIETKLADRGVVLGRRISLAPPSVEYAQVINISDYALSGQDKRATEQRRTTKYKSKAKTVDGNG